MNMPNFLTDCSNVFFRNSQKIKALIRDQDPGKRTKGSVMFLHSVDSHTLKSKALGKVVGTYVFFVHPVVLRHMLKVSARFQYPVQVFFVFSVFLTSNGLPSDAYYYSTMTL
jgi:hypothetical protein